MTTISDKTKVSIGLIGVLATTLLAGGIAIGEMRSQVAELKSKQIRIEEIAVDVAVIKTEVQQIKQALERR